MNFARLMIVLLVAASMDAQTKSSLSPDVLYARTKGAVVTILTSDAKNEALGQGSGFIVAKNRVITNYHVLAGSSAASIIFNDGAIVAVKSVVAGSQPKDLLIVEAETGNRQALTIGNELQLKVGEPVYAIGAPHGLSASLSNGLVSSFRQDEGQFLIQITAAVAPGSSGGPLLNNQGQVVGVTTSRLKGGGFGFAVGASDIQHLLKVPLLVSIQLSDLSSEQPAVSADELAPVQALFDQKKYPEALTSFQKISNPARAGFDGQQLLCRIESEIPEYSFAVKACDAAIQLKPEEATPYGLKAYALFASHELDRAEVAALKATQLSNDESFRNLLGLIYYCEEKYDLVSTQLSPNSEDKFVLTLLEGAAIHNVDSDLAVKLSSKITSLKGDNNGWKLYFEGRTAVNDLNFDLALEKFRKCDSDSDFIDPACIVSVASVETRQGYRDLAKSDISTAVSRYPTSRVVLSEAIFINLLVGDTGEATRLHEILGSKQHTAQDEFTDCLYYYGMNEAVAAAPHCAAAISGNEKNYTVWSNAGYVALDAGQPQSALSYFTKARDLFYAETQKHTGAQELDLSWGLTLAAYYCGEKKEAKALYHAIKKTYPQFATVSALKQLPLVWSANTQMMINKVIADFR